PSSFWPGVKRRVVELGPSYLDRNTSQGRRNQSQSNRSQKLSSRSRRRTSLHRRAGITRRTATSNSAAMRCEVRTQNRWPTTWLNRGTYMTIPVAIRTSTADATDQCRVFSVADARIGVIAAGLPVAGMRGVHSGDPPQPLDPLVAVVKRHDQSRRRTAFRAEGCVRKPEGDDDVRLQRSRHIEVVDICAVR